MIARYLKEGAMLRTDDQLKTLLTKTFGMAEECVDDTSLLTDGKPAPWFIVATDENGNPTAICFSYEVRFIGSGSKSCAISVRYIIKYRGKNTLVAGTEFFGLVPETDKEALKACAKYVRGLMRRCTSISDPARLADFIEGFSKQKKNSSFK